MLTCRCTVDVYCLHCIVTLRHIHLRTRWNSREQPVTFGNYNWIRQGICWREKGLDGKWPDINVRMVGLNMKVCNGNYFTKTADLWMQHSDGSHPCYMFLLLCHDVNRAHRHIRTNNNYTPDETLTSVTNLIFKWSIMTINFVSYMPNLQRFA
jgi:hypothetical protein